MSIDKSLRRKNSLARARSVLTRDERIKALMETDRWTEGRSPFNLPKVRVVKIVTKKAKKAEKAEEGAAASTEEKKPAGKGK
jgi:small basic protein (TIGR04137 family)